MERIGKLSIFILIIIFIFGGNTLYSILTTPNDYETLLKLLTRPENRELDTTGEKNVYTPFQILNGFLYYNDEDSFYRYDFEREEKSKIGEAFSSSDYMIYGEKVYSSTMNNSKSGYNVLDIICCDLDNLKTKETIICEVVDCLFNNNSIYFSRLNENRRAVYQYDIFSAKSTQICSFDDYNRDGEQYVGDLMFVIGDYLIFEGNGLNTLSSYNMKTNTWDTCFAIENLEKNLYFRITAVQAMDDYLYIQGSVCDSTKSSIAGPYEVKNAKDNGIWQVNIKSGEKKKVTENTYAGGIYILDRMLYGIDNGIYTEIEVSI